MDSWIEVTAISQAVIAFTVVVGVIGLRQARKLRILTYEDVHEARYWNLMERLSLEALRGTPCLARGAGVAECPGTPNPPREEDELIARAYFRLVETQLNVRAAGWITDNSWSVWSKGIAAQMRRWPFSAVWAQLRDEAHAEHEFGRLRAFMAQNPILDPCKKSRLSRWIRGLTGVNKR